MKRWIAFLLLVVALNFAWEMVQAKWFVSMHGLALLPATLLCFRAALGDLVITAIAFALAALVARSATWLSARLPRFLLVDRHRRRRPRRAHGRRSRSSLHQRLPLHESGALRRAHLSPRSARLSADPRRREGRGEVPPRVVGRGPGSDRRAAPARHRRRRPAGRPPLLLRR